MTTDLLLLPDPLRVLVVEDDSETRRLLAHLLRRSSYAVQVAEAASLLEAQQATEPQVAVLDLGLPDSGGLNTLLSYKEAHPNAAVVIMSGTSVKHVVLKAYNIGAQAYIVKGEVTGGTEALVDILLRAHASKTGEDRRLSVAIDTASALEREQLERVIARLNAELDQLDSALRPAAP